MTDCVKIYLMEYLPLKLYIDYNKLVGVEQIGPFLTELTQSLGRDVVEIFKRPCSCQGLNLCMGQML